MATMPTPRPSRRNSKSRRMPVVSRQDINVSKLDSLALNLVNAKGRVLLSIDFSRDFDGGVLPEIKINLDPASGDLKSSVMLFDVDA